MFSSLFRKSFWRVFASLSIFSGLVAFAQTQQSSALVVIDMQPIFVTRGGNDQDPKNQEKVNKILEIQKRAIQDAEKANIPIVFIEYETKGKTNEKLSDLIKNYKKSTVILKNTDGMLDKDNTHKKELQKYFKENKINTLILIGANGGACVHESIAGSLKNNYNVIAISSGIADFNYKDFIYPYKDQYSEFNHPNCANCSFKEVTDPEDAIPIGLPSAPDCKPDQQEIDTGLKNLNDHTLDLMKVLGAPQ